MACCPDITSYELACHLMNLQIVDFLLSLGRHNGWRGVQALTIDSAAAKERVFHGLGLAHKRLAPASASWGLESAPPFSSTSPDCQNS